MEKAVLRAQVWVQVQAALSAAFETVRVLSQPSLLLGLSSSETFTIQITWEISYDQYEGESTSP